MLGDKKFDVDKDDSIIIDNRFPDEAIFTEDDKQTYKSILLTTNAHRRGHSAYNPIMGNKRYKYINIIAPLIFTYKKSGKKGAGIGNIPSANDDLNELNCRLCHIIYYVSCVKRLIEDKNVSIYGIGTIAKTLFGTMDNEDRKLINEQLSILDNKQQTTEHIIKNQIKIINATIAHISNHEEIIQNNENILANAIKKLEMTLTTEINSENIKEHFIITNAILAASILLNSIKHLYYSNYIIKIILKHFTHQSSFNESSDPDKFVNNSVGVSRKKKKLTSSSDQVPDDTITAFISQLARRGTILRRGHPRFQHIKKPRIGRLSATTCERVFGASFQAPSIIKKIYIKKNIYLGLDVTYLIKNNYIDNNFFI
ncbi:hypothetical protein P5V15_012728 [Pogonomyrmex californicus]